MSFAPRNITRANAAATHVPVRPDAGSSAYRVYAQIPDMINGDANHFTYIFLAAALPPAYHWISMNYVADVTDADPSEAYAMKVCAIACQHSAALRVAPHTMPAATANAYGIILAASRMTITRAWGIPDADIDANQYVEVPDAARAAADGDAVDQLAGLRPAAEVNGLWDEIRAMYDAHDNGVMAQIAKAAIGMPVTQGVTLVTTGTHHFIDPHKRISTCVLAECLGANASSILGLTKAEGEDAMCHKVAHPISGGIMVGLARNLDVKDRMRAIGLNTPGVRVPAKFSPERAASAYETLINTTAVAAAEGNVSIGANVATPLVEALTAMYAAGATATTLREGEDAVKTFEGVHAYSLAWCAGYLTALNRELATGRAQMTVLQAYSIARLSRDQPTAFAAGSEHYDIVARYKRQRARVGYLAGVGLFGTPVPAAIAPPAEGG